MDPRMDSRGVLRGKCTSCDCEQYDGGEAKKKCVRPTCSHPPGKHLNLSNPSELRPNNQMPSNPQGKLTALLDHKLVPDVIFT